MMHCSLRRRSRLAVLLLLAGLACAGCRTLGEVDRDLSNVRSELDVLADVVESDSSRLDVVLMSTRRMEAELAQSVDTLTPAADQLLGTATEAVATNGQRLADVLERVDSATERFDRWMRDTHADTGMTTTLFEVLLFALTVLAAVATATLVVRTTLAVKGR